MSGERDRRQNSSIQVWGGQGREVYRLDRVPGTIDVRISRISVGDCRGWKDSEDTTVSREREIRPAKV